MTRPIYRAIYGDIVLASTNAGLAGNTSKWPSVYVHCGHDTKVAVICSEYGDANDNLLCCKSVDLWGCKANYGRLAPEVSSIRSMAHIS